jgi:peptidoglycan/LPS O-acetylase OafA/YrhL
MYLRKKDMRLILAAPFLIIAAFMLFCIFHYGVNVPFYDEWDMVPIFQKADQGTVPLRQLWAQHNEHRVFFPQLVILYGAHVTHWNIKAELLISFILSLVTALMLYLFVLSKIERRSLALIAAVLIAAWFYSPIQFENWLWGFQMTWYMCLAGVITALYLLNQMSPRGKHERSLLAGAIAAGVIATFSLGGGSLVWLVGLGILVVRKTGMKELGIWLASGVVSIGAYYYHYQQPGPNTSKSIALHQPLEFVRYVLCYFGGAVSNNPTTAILTGSILLLILVPLLYMVWLRKEKINQFLPWLSLVAFALLTCLITGLSRLNAGPDQALSSRYTAISLLYIIGLIGIAGVLLSAAKLRRQTLVIITLAAVAVNLPMLAYSYKTGVSGLRQENNTYNIVRACTHQARPTTQCLLLTFPGTNLAGDQNRLDYAKVKHWAGY